MQGRYAIRHRPFFISCIPVKEIKKMDILRRAVNTPHPPCPTVPLLLKEKAMTSALFSFRRNISSAKHISSNRRLHIEFARQTYRKSKGFIQNGVPYIHLIRFASQTTFSSRRRLGHALPDAIGFTIRKTYI